MDDIYPDFKLKIADLLLGFKSKSNDIIIESNGTVRYFIDSTSSICILDYIFIYDKIIEFNDSKLKPVFIGDPQDNELLNYKWKIYEFKNEIVIAVFFEDHKQIKVISATISPNKNNVRIGLQLHSGCNEKLVIDPLVHPLGSLLLMYLMHWKNGLLIHASGVINNSNAFLFTGVSGIGKSTMAKLWKDSGNLVLNDDRLIIRIVDDELKLYNNPMPYYQQLPAEGNLKKIFLLKQSHKNYIKPLKGVMAYSKVLGNFIQQFYNPDMVKRHLEIVESVLSRVEVYELGFKPDEEIVEMIKKMD